MTAGNPITSPRDGPAGDRRRVALPVRLAGPFAVAAAGLLMLRLSWLKWPDVLVDFGWQLYIAWQITEGKRLNVDLAWGFEPLGQYANALWFSLFGTSLWTIIAINLAVLAAITAVLYRLLLRASGGVAAAAAGIVFMVLFAFAQYTRFGNYNYVTPYRPGVTYAMLASLGAILLAARFMRRPRALEAAGAGLCLGVAFLSRIDIFVAGAAASGLCFAAALWFERPPWPRAARLGGVFAAGCALPPVVAFGLLAQAMPARDALVTTLGSWPTLAAGFPPGFRFHRDLMGTTDTAASVRAIVLWCGLYGAIFVPAAMLAMVIPAGSRWRRPAALAAFAALAAGLLPLIKRITWSDAARPLPVVLLLLAVATAVMLARARRDRDAGTALALRLALAGFAMTLLVRVILHVRVYHYGFVLAMPATMVLVLALLDWVPRWIDAQGGSGGVFRAVGLAFLLVACVGHLWLIRVVFDMESYVLTNGRDVMVTGERGEAVGEALEALDSLAGPDQTVAVLPEGTMINYLARRRNPSPYTNCLELALWMYGEQTVLDSYRRNPPDFVVLVHRVSDGFGRDYGRLIAEWIVAGYEPVRQIGAVPFSQGDEFGILIMRRRGEVER